MKIATSIKVLVGISLIPLCIAEQTLQNDPTSPLVFKENQSFEKTPPLSRSPYNDNSDTTSICSDSSDTSSCSFNSSNNLSEKPYVRILSLDGGGVRGIIEARMLMHIEKEVGKPISQIFDIIGGTSAGGMIATLLSMPDPKNPSKPLYTAEDVFNLLLTRSNNLFTQNFLSFGGTIGPKYTNSGLKKLLKEFYQRHQLKDSIVDTAVFAYDVDDQTISTLSSWNNGNILTRDAVGATTAAPTYFPAYTIKNPLHQNAIHPSDQHKSYIDGGIVANNPSVMLWMEAIKKFDKNNNYHIVSLGTGDFQKRIESQKVNGGGLITWLKYLPRLISSHQQNHTFNILNFFMKDSKKSKQEGIYTRLNPTLIGESSALDNYSPEHLNNLIRNTDIYLFNNKKEIDTLIQNLKDERYSDWIKTNEI